MGFSVQSIILFLNAISVVHLRESPLKPTTNSSTHPRSSNGDDDDDSKVTIAVVLGVGLTVVIFGCVGYFLCRGHFERKTFHNHRQLVKMERINKNGKISGTKTENEQSEEFAEEVL